MITKKTQSAQSTTTKSQPVQSDLGERKAGGLWIKTNDKGKYLSLQIEINGRKLNLNGFDNQYYAENPEKQPKYKLFWSRDTFQSLNEVFAPNGNVSVPASEKKQTVQPEAETKVDV